MNQLTSLWRSDVSYVSERVEADSRRAQDGLAFWRGLLVAAFGRGERPALQAELKRLRDELESAKQQARRSAAAPLARSCLLQAKLSELRLSHTSARISELERGEGRVRGEAAAAEAASADSSLAEYNWCVLHRSPCPRSARPARHPLLSSSLLGASPLSLWFLGQPWVLFRGQDGAPACLLDECAHRACPLSLGKVVRGCVQCPYHGWEYGAGGECSHMPSTRFLPRVVVPSFPCLEAEGWVWAWSGGPATTPAPALPRTPPPIGFSLVAEVEAEARGEAAAVLARLRACAEQPARVASGRAARTSQRLAAAAGGVAAEPEAGWEAAETVVAVAARTLLGRWESARSLSCTRLTPTILLSELQLRGEGEEGEEGEANILHQTHVCLPGRPGWTRILYRLSVNWNSWGGGLVTSRLLWQSVATELLREQLAAGELPHED